jgi:hypothetical protein
MSAHGAEAVLPDFGCCPLLDLSYFQGALASPRQHTNRTDGAIAFEMPALIVTATSRSAETISNRTSHRRAQTELFSAIRGGDGTQKRAR